MCTISSAQHIHTCWMHFFLHQNNSLCLPNFKIFYWQKNTICLKAHTACFIKCLSFALLFQTWRTRIVGRTVSESTELGSWCWVVQWVFDQVFPCSAWKGSARLSPLKKVVRQTRISSGLHLMELCQTGEFVWGCCRTSRVSSAALLHIKHTFAHHIVFD